jgi:subtilisin family serine protease
MITDRAGSRPYIIVPRSTQRIEAPTSLVTVMRGRKDLGVVLKAVELRGTEKISVTEGLKKVGMEQVTAETWKSAEGKEGKGKFVSLDTLAVTAAFFTEDREKDDAQNELGDEFTLIPDGPMSLPAPVTLAREVPYPAGPLEVADQWPLESGVRLAHGRGVRGKEALIGILDTGIDADHYEFSRQVVRYRYVPLFPGSPYSPPRDVRGFDTNGHGTHVSGIAAGGGVGVAPEAELYVCAVAESETLQTTLIRVIFGLHWILEQFSTEENVRKPAVLNMSLGFPPPEDADSGYRQRVDFMRRMLSDLKESPADVLPIVAIGNDGPGTYGFPGAFKEVIGVGAVDFDHRVAEFSGSGNPPGERPKPDVTGYGVNVVSSIDRDYQGKSRYIKMGGTSMASPYVTGIAALHRCLMPNLTAEDIERRLIDTAMPVDPAKPAGAGLARYKD